MFSELESSQSGGNKVYLNEASLHMDLNGSYFKRNRRISQKTLRKTEGGNPMSNDLCCHSLFFIFKASHGGESEVFSNEPRRHQDNIEYAHIA